MEQLSENVVCHFVVEDNQQTVVVEIETIRNLLCVFKNYGGPLNSYFCVLPRRKWDVILERRFLLSKHFCQSLHDKMHVLCQSQCPIFFVTPKVCSSPLFICAHPQHSTTPCRG
jgi:hypothetical protein